MPDLFCVHCGERLEPDARFCSACGTAIAGPAASEPAPKPTRSPVRRRGAAPRPLPWPLFILILGGALILLALAWSQLRPPVTPGTADTAGLPDPAVLRISVAETSERLQRGAVVVVDVRSEQAYAEAHIPGALSLPLGELAVRYQELPRDGEIITYCT